MPQSSIGLSSDIHPSGLKQIPPGQKDKKPYLPALRAKLLKFNWHLIPRGLRTLLGNEARLSRTTIYVIVVALMALAIGLSRLSLIAGGGPVFKPLRFLEPKPPATAIKQTGNPLLLPAAIDHAEDDVIIRAVVPHTIIPDRKKAEISTYVVQTGDTVFGIAAKFGLQPDTILWANSSASDNPDWLRVGQELLILPVDGVYHQVR
jgi:LysM repeat protein